MRFPLHWDFPFGRDIRKEFSQPTLSNENFVPFSQNSVFYCLNNDLKWKLFVIFLEFRIYTFSKKFFTERKSFDVNSYALAHSHTSIREFNVITFLIIICCFVAMLSPAIHFHSSKLHFAWCDALIYARKFFSCAVIASTTDDDDVAIYCSRLLLSFQKLRYSVTCNF